MNTKHTRGPWQTNGQTVTAKADWKLTVAVCPSMVDPRPTADVAAKSHEEAQANAKLIAAAPSLLAEAMELLRNSQCQDGYGTVLTRDIEALEAAVLRATA